MNADPQCRLRAEWPSALGAMLLLSGMRAGRVLAAQGLSLQLRRGGKSMRVFSRVTAKHLSLLTSYDDPTSTEAIAEFVAAVGGFEQRFIGSFETHSDHLYGRAVYSLVYLAKSTPIIELLLAAFVPLLRPGLWDRPFRYKLAATFWSDAEHLLYEVEVLDEAGDHEPFDWLGNLNGLSDADRHRLLTFAAIEPFSHPGFPPQDVWITHTNVQPIPEAGYRQVLEGIYKERGYVW